MTKCSLEILTAWAQIVQGPAVLAGLLFVWWQIRQANKAIRLQSLREVLIELGDPKMRKLRAEVLGRAVNDEDPEFKARTVAVALDRVGYMAKHKLLPDSVFTDLLEGMIEELWQKRLRDTVSAVSRDRPGYCKCLTWLVHEKLPRLASR